ncbi:MAG: low molecular weight protein-tyrosine-phosphatase [Chloroflexota bacterium]|jgi:protein-tyrosine phosphatase|nr:low molecular weight protein-tyrosine-phosphatase [Chloroflexota bacterium]
MNKLKIVFVCLGNYCRSPMAEAIFKQLAREDNILDRFDVSSAGTKDWDLGLRPDRRSQQLLHKHGYPLDPDKRARQITPDEIKEADYLIAMSERVAEELGGGENVFLLMDFDEKTDKKDIPDPYPSDTFPQAFALIEQGTKAFYEHIYSRIVK